MLVQLPGGHYNGSYVREALGLEQDFSDADLADLAGAPHNARVLVSRVDGQAHAVRLSVESPYTVQHEVTLLHFPDGTLTVFKDFFKKYDNVPRGYGAFSTAIQVKAAARLRFKEITGYAIGSKFMQDFNGHYTWSRLGFNGELGQLKRESLPVSLQHSESLLDLMKTQEGRDWWYDHGDSHFINFDLKEGSRNHKVLRSYLQENNYIIPRS